ncbi:MAG: monovalent cation/H+ antiporter complex subunit F [Candidatus Muirbacterium halophilum]|nr:monovalent cation/H+ antiporter complex subunit F [Candidatus Muirbacterium halophilum]MCK9476116.1 monovalent cation/H+ antiporter complex subunit F [Candidatus Muirbacterium halophilum]
MIYYIYFFLIAIFLCLIRIPFIDFFFERIVFLGAISTFVVILMCLLSVYYNKEFYLDIALMYSILSFTGMISLAWFFKRNK